MDAYNNEADTSTFWGGLATFMGGVACSFLLAAIFKKKLSRSQEAVDHPPRFKEVPYGTNPLV